MNDRRVVTFALVGALAATAGMLGLVVSAPAQASTYWLAALWAAWLAAMGWALLIPRPSLGMAGLQVFFLLEVLAPATAAVSEGRTFIGPYDVTAGTVAALQLGFVAQVCLLIGAVSVRAWHGSAPPERVQVRVARHQLDRWTVVLLGGACAALAAYVVLARSDPLTLFVLAGDAKYNEFQRLAEGPLVKYFSSLVGLAGVVLVVVALRIAVTGFRRPVFPAIAVAASVVLLTGSGGRWFLAVPAVAAVLVWWRTSSGRLAGRTRLIVIGGAAALVVFAVLVGGLRDQSGGKSLEANSFVDKQLRGGVFATTSVLVMTVPDQVDHLGGRSYAEVVAMPVPRALWPEKPEGVVKDLQRAFFPKEIGASYPFYGEAYANFGWLGAALACLSFGALLEGVWLRVLATKTESGLVIWAALVPTLLQLFSRGYLAGLVGAFFGFGLGIVLLARALRRSGAVASATVGLTDRPAPVAPTVRRTTARQPR